MAKSGKSSASSGTRKKHAKKAATSHQDEQPVSIPKDKKLTKQQRAQKKKEPRVKVYIPPVKPAPVQPDPLETTGLAHRLPPELLIVLRSFNKKAQVTKIRALEELQSGWIDKCKKDGEDGVLAYVLVDMLPVWLHHVPALFVHQSRRVRLLAAGVHLSFVQIPPVRDQMLSFLRDSASPSQIESILGTWCLAAHDVDKSVATIASNSWLDIFAFTSTTRDQLLLDDNYLSPLLSFIQRGILDPSGVHVYLNPPQPVAPVAPGKKGVRKEEPEVSLRSKSEELEESEVDRNARLRIGGLGAIRRIVGNVKFYSIALTTDLDTETLTSTLPEQIFEFFQNPALWSSLYHGEQSPFVDIAAFGHGQPNVRKATWGLILSLLSAPKERLESLLPVLSVATLRSAWTEPDTTVHVVMWQPLLKFLKEFPKAWEIERSHDYTKDDGDDDSDFELSDEEDKATLPKQSTSYQEFLHFLQLGCSGSPLQGYPTVVIIISTIPSSIIASSSSQPPLDNFFASFWKVLDSRALSSLQRAATSAAFLTSFLECMVFLIKRVRNDAQNGQISVLSGSGPVEELTVRLLNEQFSKVWMHLEDGSLKVEHRAAARLVAHTLLDLKDVDPALSSEAWNVLSVHLRESRHSNPGLVSVFFKVFYDKFKHISDLRDSVASLMSASLKASVQDCRTSIDGMITSEAGQLSGPPTHDMTFLVDMLAQFREGLFDDAEFSDLVDNLAIHNAFVLLKMSPTFLLGYLSHRKKETTSSEVWHALLSSLSENPTQAEITVKPLLEAAQRGLLPRHLKPKGREVDDLAEILLVHALEGDSARLPFIQQVLEYPDHFLSANGYTTCLSTVSTKLSHLVDSSLQSQETEVPLTAFASCLSFITVLARNSPRELPRVAPDSVLCDIFILAFLLPTYSQSQQDHHSFATAKGLWEELYKPLPEELQVKVRQQIVTKLGVVLCSTSTRPSPENVLEVVLNKYPSITFNLPSDIFPSPQEFDQTLSHLSALPIHPSLAVLHPLIPPSSSMDESSSSNEFDERGFSSYARIVAALLQVFVEDRHTAKQNLWALRHFQALEISAQDFIRVPHAKSDIFSAAAIHANLDALIMKIQQVTTYLLTSYEEEWREVALSTALAIQKSHHPGPLASFLADTIHRAQTSDNARDTRILHNILQHAFHDIDKNEAEQWMLLARKIEPTSPETTMVIVFCVANFAPEPPRLDRYRNELAASLLGIPPAKANTEGLLTLRKLCASAPNPDTDVVFLPQPRAVNVTKACQQWIASDEDIDEEVVGTITVVFYHLAPILQGISGAHWELAFDILENNLEESSLADDATLVTLARTLRLILLIQDLTSTNKSLRTQWEERKISILTFVRDLAAVPLDNVEPSIPRSTCRGLLLSLVQDLPSTLINHDTFSKMCHLVMDSSVDVQQRAYHFLALAAKKRTEHLVIEAGVDSEGTVNIDLPENLLKMLQRDIVGEDLSELPNEFGYLLAWMLLFDLFHESSLKVRSSYIDQLRNADLIVARFIPTIMHLLCLDQGPIKAFKLDIWAVDEFHVEYFETGSSFALPVLAGHLYYRALLTVPSLIHTWVTDCKDRQLSSSITTYTSQCFSPVIIRTELAHVKSPESTSSLADENFSVKVANSVNEVIASYSVDEHQLEIKLKIPPDWPLHKIEIKDLKRVGVDENRWRAWVLAVQQIIWSHNGRIVDGLGLFKKNVTLHFEGQVECAICYSIISVMDGTLPRKPCRTCKNRFHAGCLYKWFNTSHSSSCPLCRSDIF